MKKTNKIIITIGRQFGAGGRSVAAKIGARMGIPVYDSDLLIEAAKESGYSPELFKMRDEKRNLFGLSKLFSSLESNATNYMADNALFQIQSETIRQIAAKGPCVIVGRCADYILRDEPGLLSVFLTSPFDIRVQRVADRMGVNGTTAARIIRRKDRSRSNFYRRYTLRKWGDSASYDLCLDSSLLGLDATAEIIMRAANGRMAEPAPIADRPAKAVEYFMQGYGCCQSVVAAFADLYGLSFNQALKVSAGFGGGVGRMRMMCGTVSGLVILAGLEKGQIDGADRDGKADCYKLVQELLAKFKDENSSLICAELLGISAREHVENFIPAERNDEYYKVRPCAGKVHSAAKIFADYLLSK